MMNERLTNLARNSRLTLGGVMKQLTLPTVEFIIFEIRFMCACLTSKARNII